MKLESFVLLDRVDHLDLKKRRIACSSDVPDESIIYERHFPGFPVMPGVMLIEFMAQTAGLLITLTRRLEAMAFMCKVRSASFREFVRPGHKISTSVFIKHEGDGYNVAKATLNVIGQNTPVASSELMFRIMDFPAPELKAAYKQGISAILSEEQFRNIVGPES